MSTDLHDLTLSAEQLLQDESWLNLQQARKLFPRADGGRHVHRTTVERWITYGKNGVRLEACRGPWNTWYTTRAAIARWLARLTALELGQTPEPTPGLKERQAAAKKADARRKQIMGKGSPPKKAPTTRPPDDSVSVPGI